MARNSQRLAKFLAFEQTRASGVLNPSNMEGHAEIDNATIESSDVGTKWNIINFQIFKAIGRVSSQPLCTKR